MGTDALSRLPATTDQEGMAAFVEARIEERLNLLDIEVGKLFAKDNNVSISSRGWGSLNLLMPTLGWKRNYLVTLLG